LLYLEQGSQGIAPVFGSQAFLFFSSSSIAVLKQGSQGKAFLVGVLEQQGTAPHLVLRNFYSFHQVKLLYLEQGSQGTAPHLVLGNFYTLIK
jgi:hypothetical protein